MKLKKYIPWWTKIFAKIVLSRLPFDYRVWQHLGLFRHGKMGSAQYALGIFTAHVERAGLHEKLSGKSILELGPGDSVATAVIASAFGASSTLVDVGFFAQTDINSYHDLVLKLEKENLSPPNISDAYTFSDLLHKCNSSYLTQGLESLKALPSESINLIFSHAVLEHVRKGDFFETQIELSRILKPQGYCSHSIDLKDHLGGNLNNLRFSEKVWESEFFARSGFYTNRIQMETMLDFFTNANFEIESKQIRRWDALPMKRNSLAQEFRSIPDQILNVSGFDVVLTKKLS
jgi:hypothetical protein